MKNALIPRPTIEEIVKYRDQTLARYVDAYEKIKHADDIIQEAEQLWKMAAPNPAYHYAGDITEVKAFRNALAKPEKAQYLRTARKLIDMTVWEHIITMTNLEVLMDKQAKDELRKQMQYVPDKVDRYGELITQDEIEKGLPEITVGNVIATLEKFAGESDMIFRRGIANAFSKLDRKFRSHDGFRFKDRIILSNAFDGYGSWSYYRNHRDTIIDIERAFQVLDGKTPNATYASIVGIVDNARTQWGIRRQGEHIGDYFKIRIYKNGNAHLWFTRKDLLKNVNKILGEWYGEVIGDENIQEDDPLYSNQKTTPARYYGFYPTPEPVQRKLFDQINLTTEHGSEPLYILEPSAGTGNLARQCLIDPRSEYAKNNGKMQHRVKVDCVEIQPHLVEQLKAEGIYNRVICADFLKLDVSRLYDIIIMNPPFDRERDIDHVMHAYKFLKPKGRLVTIMSAGTEFRMTKKSIAFREFIEKQGIISYDLPSGSFSSVGTNVNTIMVILEKSQ